MRLCSVTMVSEHPDQAIEAAKTVDGLVDHWITYKAGMITDFAAARNAALDQARVRGYDWALMLDTDERIHCDDPAEIRRLLEVGEADVWVAMDSTKSYAKERIFRIPPPGHYEGPTHEAFIHDGEPRRRLLPGLIFSELPRTPEGGQHKLLRDLDILEKQVIAQPENPRWWYYLGDSYTYAGRREEAIDAFAKCWGFNGFGEESAWAAYRIATFLAGDGKLDEAMVWCTKGLQRHAGMAELYWLAGWCCYQQGLDQQAIYWSITATIYGQFAFRRYPVNRVSFRTPQALYEWPYDTLRHVYERMGDEDARQDADTLYHAAMAAREAPL